MSSEKFKMKEAFNSFDKRISVKQDNKFNSLASAEKFSNAIKMNILENDFTTEESELSSRSFLD